jgi:endoglucanase
MRTLPQPLFQSILAGCLLAFSTLSPAAAEVSPRGTPASTSAPLNPSGFIIARGTNLSHWLSQDFGWQARTEWITENDFRYIASLGFDHVRLPIDEKEMWDEEGRPHDDAFALLDEALGWARAHGLRVVLDLHTVRSHHFNAENEDGPANTLFTDPAAQEHFYGLWRELSKRHRHHPVDQLAYEIMNEPTAPDHEDWNRLVAGSVAVIRENEPERVLVIGSNMWQIPQTLPYLKVPEGDPNIILSTHTYAPFLFTHYRAEWTPLKFYEGVVRYPGRVVPPEDFDRLMQLESQQVRVLAANAGEVWNRERIVEDLRPAIERARELGLQLYCGEFGCLPTVPREDRLAYYRDIVAAFEENGIAWANWEYRGDFGIFEWHKANAWSGAPDVELIDALLGTRSAPAAASNDGD